jgi:sugar (pentulose or hexulose) kinase
MIADVLGRDLFCLDGAQDAAAVGAAACALVGLGEQQSFGFLRDRPMPSVTYTPGRDAHLRHSRAFPRFRGLAEKGRSEAGHG